MGKGSSTTTTSSAPNPAAASAYYSLLNQAAGVAGTPYTPYTGELTAPVNSQQATGIAGINQNANFAEPYIAQAGTLATNASQPITQAQIQNYESPYTQQVVDATQAQFNNQNQQQQEQVQGNAIAQGALGGNREAIAQAETANQENLAQAPVIAGLENQGYQTGLNTALTEQQAQQAGAYSLGNLGVAGENAALTGANAQVGAGSLEQSTQQAQDTAQYQQFLNALAYPFQTTQWLSGIDTGVGSQLGGTSSTTAPAPSTVGQLAGGLTSGVGLLGGTGAFGAAGWLAPALAALATGGGVPDDEATGVANRHPTIPESRATLHLQQQQLINGHRRVQMFPRGTAELPLPHGFHRLAADGAIFHFDPHEITSAEIRHASAKGHEHELLDLGPVSKHEVMKRLHGGEIPVAVVERHPDGTEARAAAGTHMTAGRQLAAMNRTKSPGHTVRIEDPRATLGARLRGGGHVPHYDLGGATPYMGTGAGSPGMPYTGGRTFIPTNSITRGQGAPRAPQPSQLNNQMGKIAAAAGALKNPNQGAGGQPLNVLPSGVAGASTPVGGVMPAGIAPAVSDPLGPGPYRRGGAVHGYADGGAPYDSDYFDNEFATPIQHTAPNFDIATDPSAMAAYRQTAAADALSASDAPDAPVLDSHPVSTVSYRPTDNPDQIPLPTARPTGIVPDGNITLPPEITRGASAAPSDTDQPLAFDTPSISVPQSTIAPDSPLPPKPVGVAPAANSPSIDWSGNSKLWPALMSAGFGMMASRSPYAGVAIGEGGQAGVATYAEERKEEEAAKVKQAEIDMEARKLDQEARQTQQRLSIETMPYSQMTKAQQAEVDLKATAEKNTETYRQGLLDRENSTYLGPSSDGTGSVFLDKKTGQTTIQPNLRVGPKPVTGATESTAQRLIDEREKQRAADPSIPSLSFEEALSLAHRAPNQDQDTIRRLNLASAGWRNWTGNPANMGKKDAPESKIEYWESRYGVRAAPGGGATPAPAASPSPTNGAPAPAANGAPAAAGTKPPLVRQNGHLYQLQPDGSYLAIQ